MAIYMKFEAARQGWIKGGSEATGWEGYIILRSLELGMGHPIDANTHLSTGRQVVRPIVVTKEVDNSSPLLITTCATNEVARTVTVAFVGTGTNVSHAAFMTVQLKNATIQDFNLVTHEDGSTVEKITLVFTTVEVTWIKGGIVASVDAIAPT